MLSFLHHISLSGASITACRKLNRHIVALEADEVIFKAILHPMIRATNTAPSDVISTASLVDEDEEPLLPPKVERIRTCT
jgi:hypothetical protein